MNKVALYFRLSVEERSGREESESISSQRQYLTHYLKSHEELKNSPYEEYIDDGFSGTNVNRPAFQRMMDDIRDSQIHTIVVKDFSRFMRDYITIGDYLENIFPFMGVRFISINDGYDSKNEVGNGTELDIQFKNLLYDFYAKDASEKVKSVTYAMKKQGKFLAWSPPFGYMKDPEDKHKIIVDEKTAFIVKEAFALALKGYSTRNIAKEFLEKGYPTPSERKKELTKMDYSNKMTITEQHKKPIWMHGTVIKLLANENYTGTYCYNMARKSCVGSKAQEPVPKEEWGRVFNHHEALVSQKDFDIVRKLMAKKAFVNIDYSKVQNANYILKGCVVCQECGHILAYSTSTRINKTGKKKHEYLMCRTCIAKDAKRKNIRLKDAVDQVWEKVKILLQDEAKSEKVVVPEILKEETLSDLEKAKEDAFLEYKQGRISREKFKAIKNELDESIETVKKDKKEKTQIEAPLPESDTLTREMVERFVERVVVSSVGEIFVELK